LQVIYYHYYYYYYYYFMNIFKLEHPLISYLHGFDAFEF